ncbi:ATP-binding protein [Streptomyces sp. ST2-7A]|uniref:ATP-binding protein n=1 Tax=Streptomyces sp. ST2-7A TaxID=2907214 RepID=UPI001F2EA57D|nr:ATP-binding protein [Streptomyces sp. ST2-7A]MCE7082537.1 ATP-binding protein [Streptomyces sp. ST2-7A]
MLLDPVLCGRWRRRLETIVFVASPTPNSPVIPASEGYVKPLPGGFSIYFNADAARLRIIRDVTTRVLRAAGAGAETCENARLIVSELIGNCVRACGDGVPVVVDIEVEPTGVWIRVHDPESRRLPTPSRTAMDDPAAETGRGLGLVDLLAPGRRVVPTAVGKQIVCRLPRSPGERAA